MMISSKNLSANKFFPNLACTRHGTWLAPLRGGILANLGWHTSRLRGRRGLGPMKHIQKEKMAVWPSSLCERKTRLELATPTLARLASRLKVSELSLIFITGVVNLCSYHYKYTANLANKQGPLYPLSHILVIAILNCYDLSVGRVKKILPNF